MINELDIYLHQQLVGRLTQSSNQQLSFQYDEQYMNSIEAIPLSLSLPLQSQPFSDTPSKSFFSNLLPEGDVRKKIADILKVSVQNDFAFFEALGGECAGAVSLMPNHKPLPTSGKYTPITENKLDEFVRTLPQHPLLIGKKGVRLSLAGAQNKLPVYILDDEYYIPTGEKPSSHIIKPAIQYYQGVVANEYFCMKLAETLGLTVAKVSIRDNQQQWLVVERYDRTKPNNKDLIRIHQEDFCQSLSIAPTQKYEAEGGPSLADCFKLLKTASINPAQDQTQLISWVIFNFLIGNADAHAKNISLLLTDEGPKLAPFYDLLSTSIYPELSQKMAMKIGGENRPQWTHTRHWQRFADAIDIKLSLIQEIAEKIMAGILIEAEHIQGSYSETQDDKVVLQKVISIIKKRSANLHTRLTNIQTP